MVLSASEGFLWRLLWKLCRLSVLLSLCWGLLALNLHLAQASLQAWGAVQGVKLAADALSQAADKLAHTSHEAAYPGPAPFCILGWVYPSCHECGSVDAEIPIFAFFARFDLVSFSCGCSWWLFLLDDSM